MLKHKQILASMAILMAVGTLIFASCQKENTGSLPEGAILLTADAFSNGNGAKGVVDSHGSKVFFTEGDQIWINGNTYTVQENSDRYYIVGSQIDANEDIHAVYPASIVPQNPTWSATDHTIQGLKIGSETHTYAKTDDGYQKLDAPMVAFLSASERANNNTLKFKHISAALTVRVANMTNFEVKMEKIYISSALFNGTPAIYHMQHPSISFENPSVSNANYAADAGYKTSLDFSIEDDGNNTCTIPANGVAYFQIPILPQAAAKLKINVTTRNAQGNLVGSKLAFYKEQSNYTFSISNGSLAYVPATIYAGLTEAERTSLGLTGNEMQIDGLFSVSASKKVFFAKGNLKYKIDATDATARESWAFLDNQYDILEGSNTTYASSVKKHPGIDGWASLFLYGANGEEGNSSDVTPATLPASAGGKYTTNGDLSAGTPNFDWGIRIGDGWYTLSEAEWGYLLKDRNLTSNYSDKTAKLYELATVCGMYGMIIYPDKYFETTRGIEAVGSNLPLPAASGDVNSDLWKKMESRGCVFLPAAGQLRRYKKNKLTYESKVVEVGDICYYWTSTSSTDSPAGGKVLFLSNDDPAFKVQPYTTGAATPCCNAVRLAYTAQPAASSK